MRYLKKEEDLMLELDPKFQKELFLDLLKNYNRKTLSENLNKSEPILYHYKNNRVKAIPKVVVLKAVKLSKYSRENLSRHILKTFSAKESIRKIMEFGAKINHKQSKERLSIRFGAYSLLERKKGLLMLDVLNWLDKNQWIERLKKQKGLIKQTKIDKITKTYIKISYLVYNKKTKKCEPYSIFLPRFLVIDNNFCYFLGLLFGDGLHGARVGIVNIDKDLIKWTASFLRDYFKHNIRKAQLFLYQKQPPTKIKELFRWLYFLSEKVEIYHNSKARGSYVFNIFITNKILRRILDDFILNLEKFFINLSYTEKGSFLAGLFDAEGNVNKLGGNLRFSQKKENNVRIIQSLLEREGYHTRYDGSNIIIGFRNKYKKDFKLFKKQITPFLKHSIKTRRAEELIKGYLVRRRYKPLLQIILENPNILQKQIAIRINKTRCQRELVALLNAGFVSRKKKRVDESFKYNITNKGLKYLTEK